RGAGFAATSRVKVKGLRKRNPALRKRRAAVLTHGQIPAQARESTSASERRGKGLAQAPGQWR
ncbi:hypothetical protein, partial [Streptomyces sp. NPDC087297]|uniref:hypothetical protein n=1 Tax=Streptomyces sp. NPDC087297 TaxID=3365778 RepID=UPI00382E1E72